MTHRLAPPDPHPGLVDRVAAWLFPSLYPVAPEASSFVDLEPEAEL